MKTWKKIIETLTTEYPYMITASHNTVVGTVVTQIERFVGKATVKVTKMKDHEFEAIVSVEFVTGRHRNFEISVDSMEVLEAVVGLAENRAVELSEVREAIAS